MIVQVTPVRSKTVLSPAISRSVFENEEQTEGVQEAYGIEKVVACYNRGQDKKNDSRITTEGEQPSIQKEPYAVSSTWAQHATS